MKLYEVLQTISPFTKIRLKVVDHSHESYVVLKGFRIDLERALKPTILIGDAIEICMEDGLTVYSEVTDL